MCETNRVNNLENADFIQDLHFLFEYYNKNLQEVLELATIESNGIRPVNIENEIYSAFHHINRAIFEIENINDAKKELDHAVNSHLKRVELDSYKISLNSLLYRSEKLITDYEFLLSDSDFRMVYLESVELFKNIRLERVKLSKTYKEAKSIERKGSFSEAILKYNDSLDIGYSLQDKIDIIENNQSFKTAILAVHKKEKQSMFIPNIGYPKYSNNKYHFK